MKYRLSGTIEADFSVIVEANSKEEAVEKAYNATDDYVIDYENSDYLHIRDWDDAIKEVS